MAVRAANGLVESAALLIGEADALVVTAGAGMGVDSGLPDFRGRQGFWNAYPALGRDLFDFQTIATPGAFESIPSRAWGFYGHRLAQYRRTEPHVGYGLLKHWGDRMPGGYTVFTSNVDGHFQKAGFDPRRVRECHGSIHYLQCLTPCCDETWSADEFVPDVDEKDCRLRGVAPTCPRCGAVARPNVLMFNDLDWCNSREETQAARQEQWLLSISRPVVVEFGAGMAIPTVRRFSERIAQSLGGRLIRINPRDFDVPAETDIGLAMSALEGIKAIAAVLGRSSRCRPSGGDPSIVQA
jgi:NAD-dependent SIR2 family protein deacetylase